MTLQVGTYKSLCELKGSRPALLTLLPFILQLSLTVEAWSCHLGFGGRRWRGSSDIQLKLLAILHLTVYSELPRLLTKIEQKLTFYKNRKLNQNEQKQPET